MITFFFLYQIINLNLNPLKKENLNRNIAKGINIPCFEFLFKGFQFLEEKNKKIGQPIIGVFKVSLTK